MVTTIFYKIFSSWDWATLNFKFDFSQFETDPTWDNVLKMLFSSPILICTVVSTQKISSSPSFQMIYHKKMRLAVLIERILIKNVCIYNVCVYFFLNMPKKGRFVSQEVRDRPYSFPNFLFLIFFEFLAMMVWCWSSL